MRGFYKVWIGLILLTIITVGLLSFLWDEQMVEMHEESFKGSYVYSVSLTTNETLSNVTLYIPIPIENNESHVGQDIIKKNFNEDSTSWEYALVETEHGPMLSMKKKNIDPKYMISSKDSEVVPMPSIDFGTIVFFNESIDTKDPVGREEVLSPKYNLTSFYSVTSDINADSYKYDSMIYAHYETPSDANVVLIIEFDAINEWWSGEWQSNSYRERINAELSGPQESWTIVTGELVTGEGTYLEEN